MKYEIIEMDDDVVRLSIYETTTASDIEPVWSCYDIIEGPRRSIADYLLQRLLPKAGLKIRKVK